MATAVLVLCATVASPALACSCLVPPIEDVFERSDVVAEVQVTQVNTGPDQHNPDDYTDRSRVLRAYSGRQHLELVETRPS